MSNTDIEILDFELSSDYIELIKLLKLFNLVESGAEAKLVVKEGLVICNNEVEFRKRRKLKSGDLVKFASTTIKIV